MRLEHGAALPRRAARSIRTQFWSGTLGDTITIGNLTVQLGVRYDIQQAEEPAGHLVRQPASSRTCSPAASTTTARTARSTTRPQFDYTNWQPRVSATYALGEKKTTLLRASYAQFADQLGFLGYYGSGVPISNGYYYYWTDMNHDHIVQPDEVALRGTGSTASTTASTRRPAEQPERDRSELQDAADRRVHLRRRPAAHRHLAVSGTFTYRKTTNLQDTSLRHGRHHRRLAARGTSPTGTAVAHNGSRSRLQRALLQPDLAPSPPGVTLNNRPGRDAEVLRRRRLGRQTTVGPLDGAGELRLEQLHAVTRAGVDQGSEQLLGAGDGTAEHRRRPRVPRSGTPSKDYRLHQRELAVQRQRALPGPVGDQPRRELLRHGRAIPIPTTSEREPPTPPAISHQYNILIGQVDTFRYDNVYRARFAPGEDIQHRSAHRHAGGRALQRHQRRHDPAALLSASGRTGLRAANLHAEPVLQPDPRGAESADPEAGHHASTSRLAGSSSGARPGIPGGPFCFSAGDENGPHRKAGLLFALAAGFRPAAARRRPAPRRAAPWPAPRGFRATSSSSRSTRCASDAVGFDGNPRGTTPNLDRFAAEGRVFTQAHSHNVITLPSHTNILTGMLPYQHGVRENAGFRLSPKIPTARHAPEGEGLRDRRVRRRLSCSTPATGSTTTSTSTTSSTGTSTSSSSSTSSRRAREDVVKAALEWFRVAGRASRDSCGSTSTIPTRRTSRRRPTADRYTDDLYLGEVAYTDASLAPLLEAVRAYDPRAASGRDRRPRRGARRARRADARPLLLRGDAPHPAVRLVPGPRRARPRRRAGAPHRHPADDPRRARRAEAGRSCTGQSLLAARAREAPRAATSRRSRRRSTAAGRRCGGSRRGGDKYIDLPIRSSTTCRPIRRRRRTSPPRRRPDALRRLRKRLLELPAATHERGHDRVGGGGQAAEPRLPRRAPARRRTRYGPADDPKTLIGVDQTIHKIIGLPGGEVRRGRSRSRGRSSPRTRR